MDMRDHRILDAETAVLGSMLIAPEIVGEAMLRLRAEDFLDAEYRSVFAAIRRLWQQSRPVDAVTVLHQLGGDAYEPFLREIMEATPTAANWEAYADILAEQARLTRIKASAAQIINAATLDDARAAVEAAGTQLCARRDARAVSFADGLSDFYRRQAAGKVPNYIPWGIRQLDEQLYAEPGDFIILGGYPSAGKTLLATQFAWHMSSTRRVGFFSLETSPAKIFDRLISQVAEINFTRIKRHTMQSADYTAAGKLAYNPDAVHLDVINASGFDVADVQAHALAKQYDVIFLDYVQLLRATGNTRVEQVTNISLALHTMAQRTGITIVALSQLSRPEKGAAKSRTPQMSDLRESGQLEQDADAIMILKAAPDNTRTLSIVKNKEGERGAIKLSFDAAHLRLQPLSDREAPGDDAEDDDEFPRMQPWPKKET